MRLLNHSQILSAFLLLFLVGSKCSNVYLSGLVNLTSVDKHEMAARRLQSTERCSKVISSMDCSSTSCTCYGRFDDCVFFIKNLKQTIYDVSFGSTTIENPSACLCAAAKITGMVVFYGIFPYVDAKFVVYGAPNKVIFTFYFISSTSRIPNSGTTPSIVLGSIFILLLLHFQK
ncbi:hypothetical protein Aperf_G00000084217 [Anoplocephala perfoliata]